MAKFLCPADGTFSFNPMFSYHVSYDSDNAIKILQYKKIEAEYMKICLCDIITRIDNEIKKIEAME